MRLNRIIGGEEANQNEFPWMATIMGENTKENCYEWYIESVLSSSRMLWSKFLVLLTSFFPQIMASSVHISISTGHQ